MEAAQQGEVQIRLMVNKDFKGMRIRLHDRWIHPMDTVAKHYAMFSFEVPQDLLTLDKWHNLKLE